MNVHDSEKISGMLLDLGYTPSNDFKNANIIILNIITAVSAPKITVITSLVLKAVSIK